MVFFSASPANQNFPTSPPCRNNPARRRELFVYMYTCLSRAACHARFVRRRPYFTVVRICSTVEFDSSRYQINQQRPSPRRYAPKIVICSPTPSSSTVYISSAPFVYSIRDRCRPVTGAIITHPRTFRKLRMLVVAPSQAPSWHTHIFLASFVN